MESENLSEGERTQELPCSRCTNDRTTVRSKTDTSVEYECDECGKTGVAFI